MLPQGDELDLEPADFRTVKLAGAPEFFYTFLLNGGLAVVEVDQF